ncbi:helix-turn-helix domain-containing protein [Sediminispirochaeta smaragdinae]|nr:helix-turn-helix transcriptional regulator [Sediminispirochaeta smaragdinae]
MDFIDRVKEELRNQKKTQEWLAWKAGISYNTLKGWTAKGRLPNVEQATAIAKALNTTVEYLVTGEEADSWQPPHRYADLFNLLEELDEPELEAMRVLAEGYVARKQNRAQREA